ncbi:MAG TPA: FecR family protein [Bdellovibrionales bacterium]|nr:FecR family protein [Bdellovibrionales bacterium]
MNVLLKLSVALFAVVFTSDAFAQNVHGVLRVVKGDVQIKSAKSGQNARARIGEKVFPKDVVITGKDARAKIVMVDNNEINVSPESQIEIQHYEFDPAAGKKEVLLNVIYGKVRSKVEQKYDGKTSKFQIKTPSAVAGVRGTDFMTGYNPSTRSSQVVTFEGRVEFGLPGPGGTIMNPVSVTPGNMASNSGSAAPAAPIPVPKEDLAKMDVDTKNDTPKADSPATDKREPAADAKKEPPKEEVKKEEPKKDDGKKSAGGGGASAGGSRAPANNATAGGGSTIGLDKQDTAPPPPSTVITPPQIINVPTAPVIYTPPTSVTDAIQNSNQNTKVIIKVQ